MKVSVWDTYVTKKDGSLMHFDIIVRADMSNVSEIFSFGKAYLKTKGLEELSLTSNECRFCHIETLKPEWEEELKKNGYCIFEMENCN